MMPVDHSEEKAMMMNLGLDVACVSYIGFDGREWNSAQSEQNIGEFVVHVARSGGWAAAVWSQLFSCCSVWGLSPGLEGTPGFRQRQNRRKGAPLLACPLERARRPFWTFLTRALHGPRLEHMLLHDTPGKRQQCRCLDWQPQPRVLSRPAAEARARCGSPPGSALEHAWGLFLYLGSNAIKQ